MILLIISCAMIILTLFICLYIYNVAFYSPQKRRDYLCVPLQGEQFEAVSEHIERMSNIMQRIPFEAVSISSFDGCQLYGRYYHVRDGAPVQILFHGYRSCAFRDCSGAHALSRKMGFNALVVDQRAHGNSGCTTISFGNREHRDCFCWVEYVNQRFGSKTPIILSGLSMGAATVLMATGLALPDNVSCVLADSPYSAPSAIIEKVCADLHYPTALCRPFIHLSALLFGSFRLNGCTAKQAVSTSSVPILLIHGADDRLVPCSMSFEIASCCRSAVSVHTFPNAGHGLSYLIDPIRYEKVVYDFLIKIPGMADEISDSFHNRSV